MAWRQGGPTSLILIDKKLKPCIDIDVATPGDCRIREKEIEKLEKYQNLKKEPKRLWPLKDFGAWMDKFGVKLNVGMVQTSVLLGTVRILKKGLDM